MNRYFTEDIQMAHKHMNTCSTSLTSRVMQIKTMRRYYCIPIRMGKMKNSDDTKRWLGWIAHTFLVKM